MSHADLAAYYGSRTIAGLLAGKSEAWVFEHARLAGSYGRLALQAQYEQRLAEARARRHRGLVDHVFATIPTLTGVH